MKLETAAIHTPGRRRDGAVAAPIHLSTTYEHGPANEDLHGFHYIREGNPNVADLEARLSALEGGEDAVVFASGMAAGTAVLSGQPQGSEILFHHDVYMDFRTVASDYFSGWGLSAKFIDMTDDVALDAALSAKTALVWFESPSNPLMDILDIRAIAEKARRAGAKSLVDGTFATPALQRPIELGADYVLHSLTKYMGGHSDIQGGAIVMRNAADAKALRETRRLTGGALAPFSAWLISRGLQTLACRIDRHSENARRIAEWLAAHPKIDRVRYPFLKSHPGFDIARQQMKSGGGMMSIDLKGGYDAAVGLARNVKLFISATSLGGVESLLEHRASVEGDRPRSPQNLLRLSIGLEHPDDLIADLDQALAKV